MAEVIKMPQMSDTMEEGVVVEWLKEVGDKIEPGDILAEVETDKATMELESYQEGTLLHIEVKEGPVPVNGVLAVLGEEGEDYKDALKEAKGDEQNDDEEGAKASEEKEADQGEKRDEGAKTEGEESSTEQPAQASSDKEVEPQSGRIKASPLARAMARDAGIDLQKVSGSGDQGRIIKRDIEAYLESKPTEEEEKGEGLASRPTLRIDLEDTYESVTVSQMRKTIARRLSESKFGSPHFYLTIELDMDRVIEARKAVNEVAAQKISFNDIIIKAVALSLRHHPAVNASWHGDHLRRHRNIHVGVAVAVDEGLLVPVIRNADYKSMTQINSEVKDLAERARQRKLDLEEMKGNTFTVSNLGMFGIEEFTAIINPPDSCIMAVGAIIQKPIVRDNEIVIGNRMKVTMSCDHRVVDGATGAKYLQTFKGFIENPLSMLV